MREAHSPWPAKSSTQTPKLCSIRTAISTRHSPLPSCYPAALSRRPSFVEILASLTHLRKMLGGRTPPVRRVIESPEHSCQLPGAIDAVQPLMCMPGSAGSGGPSGTGGGAGAMSTSPAMAAAAAAGCPHAAAALGLAPEVVRPTRLTVNLPPAVRNQSRVYRVSSSGNFGPGICSSAGHTDEDSQAADDSFAEGGHCGWGDGAAAGRVGSSRQLAKAVVGRRRRQG